MRFAPYLFCLGLALAAPFACSSSSTTTTAVVRPELVAVDPKDFLGSVPCQAPRVVTSDTAAEVLPRDPNAAHSYVATLFDVTPAADGAVPDAGTPLASSPPTTCLQPVTFAFVVAGRRYLAQVDAYREDPDELTPIAPGSRLVTNAQGTRVVPSWAATCDDYPPSRPLDAGVDSAGAASAQDAGPPGVVSYATITRTPHECGQGLHAPNSD
jgi:hypothetical protein